MENHSFYHSQTQTNLSIKCLKQCLLPKITAETASGSCSGETLNSKGPPTPPGHFLFYTVFRTRPLLEMNPGGSTVATDDRDTQRP